jgi:hypothetical protein
MSTELIVAYEGHDMQFRDDGWLNATSAALRFGKEAVDWLRQADVMEYVCAIADRQNPACGYLQHAKDINELYSGKTESPGSRAKLAAFIHHTGLVAVKTRRHG